jgi:flagellar biosynthesis/type III secretory pathway protein FliH
MSFVVLKDASRAEALPPLLIDPAAQEAEIAERVEREVARLRQRAEAEGRARGEAEARRLAQAAKLTQEAAVASAVAAVEAVWSQLAAPLAHKEEALADLVTELAFVLAQHIVGLEVTLRPDSVKALVESLIEEAARERGAQQSIVVRLHPADHAVLAPLMQIETVHLLADAQIAQGGTIVERIAPGGDPIDKVEWDAMIETRIETVRAALGLNAETAAETRRQAA